MYYPYFRGKQFELLAIKESAELIKENNFLPIVEPVRENTKSLKAAIDVLETNEVNFCLICNPTVGDFKNNCIPLEEFIMDNTSLDNVTIGFIVESSTKRNQVESFFDQYADYNKIIVHAGFEQATALAKLIKDRNENVSHVFIDSCSGKLYRRHFRDRKKNNKRILIRDGFKKRKNADYLDLPRERFSDLHITFEEEGMDGFGDFLIVGKEYMEAGGPAYAIAIHITNLNEEEDMYINHFVSDSISTPKNPAGKFSEALEKLNKAIDNDSSGSYATESCNEFKELYNREHFPGLGYTKKLSMKHHMELMSDFLREEQ